MANGKQAYLLALSSKEHEHKERLGALDEERVLDWGTRYELQGAEYDAVYVVHADDEEAVNRLVHRARATFGAVVEIWKVKTASEDAG